MSTFDSRQYKHSRFPKKVRFHLYSLSILTAKQYHRYGVRAPLAGGRAPHIQGVSQTQMRLLFAPAEQYVYSPEVSQTPHSSGVLCLKNCPKFND